MNSSEIRSTFLEYFRERGHQVVPSSSLVPANDPTLLFANSGMVQFKDLFLGVEQRGYNTAVTAQKCVRAGGKHNDLEEVGPSLRHNTFFEMLGNFSFGDYFKQDAITWAWDLLTNVYQIPASRLRPTIYEDDDEAAALWQSVAGFPQSQIIRLGKSTNFWEVGDTGPCGPNSEIFFDKRPDLANPDDTTWNVDDDSRWIEIWNLVFTQFDRQLDGTYVPLARKNIDTGMGLERLAMVMQGVNSNYETDLFVPIMQRTRELAGQNDAEMQANIIPYRVIADHARCMTFLISDGVVPGSDTRNYVLRKIMRRAMRFGRNLGFDGPFLGQIADTVIEVMGDHYHELVTNREVIKKIILSEETLYKRTIEAAINRFEEIADRLAHEGESIFPGDEAFRLYDTFGFSRDLLGELTRERGLALDEQGFERALEEQRHQGKGRNTFVEKKEKLNYAEKFDLHPTEFLGYETLETEATIVAIIRNGEMVEEVRAEGNVTEPDLNIPPNEQRAGMLDCEIVLDRTPFYAERGGQVGDRGFLYGENGATFAVLDTQKRGGDVYVMRGLALSGSLKVGDSIQAVVPEQRRKDVMRNHTATHLLHQALRDVLGPHLYQRGSLVEADYLRFDFNHYAQVGWEDLREVERQVNAHIRKDIPVTVKYCTYEEAIKDGAIALFNEKYGATVREVLIDTYSRELCGGTHCHATGEVGFIRIIGEQSIGSGMRRIEAVSGRGAEQYVEQQLQGIQEVAARLQTRPDQLLTTAEQVSGRLKQAERRITELERKLASGGANSLFDNVQEIGGVKVLAAVVEASSRNALGELGDTVRDKLGSGVVVLGAIIDEQAVFLAIVNPEAQAKGISAGDIIGKIAPIVGGKGGGRPDRAQGGGKDASKLDQALAEVSRVIAAKL